MKYYDCCGTILMKPTSSGAAVSAFLNGVTRQTLLIDMFSYRLPVGTLFGQIVDLIVSINGSVLVGQNSLTNGTYTLQWDSTKWILRV